MHDSTESTQGLGERQGPWLLLIHQIPPKPDYFRVKVRRRLKQLGAIALKNSVYVLPNIDDAMEDFQWLRRMVLDEGGDATLCAASLLEGVTDDDVDAMFRSQSDEEFGEIIAIARSGSGMGDIGVRRLKQQLAHADARNFYASTLADTARRAVSDLDRRMRTQPVRQPKHRGHEGVAPLAATWVTRKGVYVDRVASAWLIRRFIDPEARFKFVGDRGYKPMQGELRFDMYEGEYTHEGEDCTFEVLMTRFGLQDDAIRAISEIVHDIDCKDEKFLREETPGVANVIHGITLTSDDDNQRIERAAAVFDGIYSTFRRQHA